MTSTRLKFILVAAVLGLVIGASQGAAAVVAYNNLRADDSYYWGAFYNLGRFPTYDMLGQRFTPVASGMVGKIELGLTFRPPTAGDQFTRNVDELTLALVPDVDGKPGSEELWSQFYVDKATTELETLSTFEVDSGPLLEAGTKYWLTCRSALVGNIPHAWFLSPLDLPSEPSARVPPTLPPSVGPWRILNTDLGRPFAMRVTVIPEPAAAAMMLAASATLLAVRRRPSS